MGADSNLGCVFLASGYGKRFGGDKLSALFCGVPMSEYVFANHPSQLFHSTVVVTRTASIAIAAVKKGLAVAENIYAEDDISLSIKLGLQMLPKGLAGYMFSPCDMPYITPLSIARLVDAFAKNPSQIVAFKYKNEFSSPAIFPKSLVEELMQLPKNTGGQAVIKNHLELLNLIDINEKELMDIDFQSDLPL